MVSARKNKNQQKRHFSQLDETLNDFVIGNSVNVTVSENENLGQETNGQSNDTERVDKSMYQSQVTKNGIGDQFTRAVSSAVMTVKNRMHDAILTAMDKMITPRIEMTVKSITGSTGHETNSEVQNPDRRDFLGNLTSTLLMSASSRLNLDNELNRNDETRNDVDFEDGD